MRLSRTLIATRRNPPADAASPAHGALLRAGLIHEVDPGVHVHAPMLRRVVDRLRAVLRDELWCLEPDEVATPSLVPADLAGAGGGPAGLALRDARGTALHLTASATGAVVHYVAARLDSYRQLPVRVVTCGRRFRDAAPGQRSQLGAREATVLEVLALDADEHAVAGSWARLRDGLVRALERCELDVELVRASPAAAGDPPSLRLVATTDEGATRALVSDAGGYAALPTVARSDIPPPPPAPPAGEMRAVPTPGARTIGELRDILPDVPVARMLKTVLYLTGDGVVVAALCRGDRGIDEVKLSRHLGGVEVGLADEATVREITGAEPGFAGPVGLPGSARVIADRSVADLGTVVCGANTSDQHLVDVRLGRDLPDPELADLDAVGPGDVSPDGGRLREVRGHTVGEITPLGPVEATFVTEDGDQREALACAARVDLERVLVACVEQHGDPDALRWPLAIAPHAVTLIQARADDPAQTDLAGDLYARLGAAGIDVVWDDREARIGVKFNDAELVGVPIHVVVGRDAAAGRVELRLPDAQRRGAVVPADEAVERIVETVDRAGAPTSG